LNLKLFQILFGVSFGSSQDVIPNIEFLIKVIIYLIWKHLKMSPNFHSVVSVLSGIAKIGNNG
jgi:hypothetical protein